MEQKPVNLPEGYICMLDFDRMYSKGLLLLSKYPQEQRFQQLRLPVVGLSLGWGALHVVLGCQVWKYVRKRLGRVGAALGVVTWTLVSAAFWAYCPFVREYFRLEWTLTQKYRPMLYNT